LADLFLSCIDWKQQQNDLKLCAKDLGEKCNNLGLVSIFGRFSSLGLCTFSSKHFSTILTGNNNKMSKNDVRVVWVQKQVIMCWFLTFGSFRVKLSKHLTDLFLSRIDRKQQHIELKLCAKDLGEKCNNLGLVSILGRFSSLGSCTFVLRIF